MRNVRIVTPILGRLAVTLVCFVPLGFVGCFGGSSPGHINKSQMATPVISPGTENLVNSQTVVISDGTPGAGVLYTVDGSTPTLTSPAYTNPFTVARPAGTNIVTVKAYAPAENASYTDSAVATATYTFVQDPTIQAGIMPGLVTLNDANVALPVTTTSCQSMTYTATPAFPVPTKSGGVLAQIRYDSQNPCQPLFSPGSTMPEATGGIYQYVIALTAVGVSGTVPATASVVVELTAPPIAMDSKTPVSPPTLPAGSGSVNLVFNGVNCGFVSYNGLASTGPWSGTLYGLGSPAAAEAGFPVTFNDCNHVSFVDIYSGALPGDVANEYLFNPPPGGGVAGPIPITWVATSNLSSVVASGDGKVALLKPQPGANPLGTQATGAVIATSQGGVVDFGANAGPPAGGIYQVIACGSKGANFCGLGKDRLTVFASSGAVTARYSLPEEAAFAVADESGGIYLFSKTGRLYSLKNGAFTLADEFASKGVVAAAISANRLSALTSDGFLLLFDAELGKPIATVEVPGQWNNISITEKGSVVLGKLGSAGIRVLDPSGALHSYALPSPLKTLVQQEQGTALASLESGDVVMIDSLGKTALLAHAASPEDLNGGFRLLGRTLVLVHVDQATGNRQIVNLAVEQQ
jgi:hypothetical protein